MADNHTTSEPIDVRAIARALAAPFSETEVKFKPQAVKGNRALALAYVDVRAIMDRLDNVLGFENWQDDYQLLPDNSVLCRLRLRIGKKWVTKMDVGGPSEQPDGGDRLKAAVSDALKRAAVKFGIGRYLYRLPQQWADYDPFKRQFTSPPRMPDWAIAPKPAKGTSSAAAEKKRGLPANGKELHRRLRDADNDLASQGLCPVGALLAHVTQAGVKAGFGSDLNDWAGPAIELAIAETRAFKSHLPLGLETKSVA
ncbi:MAG TPA: Rad52/Rad22 family DNA repair protein [Gemmataceae bacterium]|nr:Rad52/Rad22 family DNA repair protein [Gemmataceae bacterium]